MIFHRDYGIGINDDVLSFHQLCEAHITILRSGSKKLSSKNFDSKCALIMNEIYQEEN